LYELFLKPDGSSLVKAKEVSIGIVLIVKNRM